MWFLFAVLSSVFAALTSILAKVGIQGVDSALVTALRTAVVLAMSWVMVFVAGKEHQISAISTKSWVFIVLSGLATGFSWLCYFYALKNGPASKVAPIDKFSIVITVILAAVFLREAVSFKMGVGCALIAAGMLVMVM